MLVRGMLLGLGIALVLAGTLAGGVVLGRRSVPGRTAQPASADRFPDEVGDDAGVPHAGAGRRTPGALAFAGGQAASRPGPRSMRLVVTAAEVKRSGRPWDGEEVMPIFGNFLLPSMLTSPPDLKLGVLDESGRFAVYEGDDCRDSIDCVFEGIPVPAGAFALLIVDADVSYHDIVDALVFVPDGQRRSPADVDALVERLRRQAHAAIRSNPLTTPLFAVTRPHEFLPKKVSVFTLDDCRDAPCALRQSSVEVG